MQPVLPDHEAYTAIERRGPSALAWEVLRRDPAYQDAYHSLTRVDRENAPADADFAERWGLHFR